jgi:parallel beta-helix repeat protein
VEKITGYYPSAVKIFNQSYRVTCRDNLVIDQPDSNGIWYDVGNVDGVFVDNWIEGCQDGFFFEISKGAICAGNVFVNCDKGVRVLNSSNVSVYNNTFVNTVASFERTERSAVGDHFGWHPATGPGVEQRDGHVFVNNLLTADETFAKELLRFEQPVLLRERLTKPQVKVLDGNVFVRLRAADTHALIVWSPAATETSLVDLPSLAEFLKLQPQFSSHSQEFSGYRGPLFKGRELQRFELLRAFPGAATAVPLPAEIRQLLGRAVGSLDFPGAYQPIP